ncbi:MAG: tetratricopeptide repeat protein [Crocinitomicaceae bacterium]|nr:tetratricopeptide repeat protein [Crocinitomicaceae bacterium]
MKALKIGQILWVVIIASSVIAQNDPFQSYNDYKQKNDEVGIVKSAVQIGDLYQQQQQPDSAIVFFELAINNDLKINCLDVSERARVNYVLGNLFRLKGKYKNAVEYYETALSIAVENNLKQREASTLNSLGGLYVEIEEYDKGLEYCKGGLAIYQEYFPEKEADICLLLTNIGNISVEVGNYNEAQVYLEKAKKINEKINDDYYASLIYSGLGVNSMKQKKFDQALNYLNKALEYSNSSNNIPSEAAVLANMGQTFMEMEDYENAEKVLLESYQKTIDVDDKYLQKQLLTTLIELYSSSDQYDLAYTYQVKLTDLRDSLLSKDIMVELATAEMKYENAQNEKRILELQVQNERQSFMLKRSQYQMIIGFSLLALVVISLVLIYQRNRSRNEAKIQAFENKMFRLQIKPHFIFNVLSSIQGYMNLNESKQASVYLSKFARLIRNVLEQSRKDFIPISKEIQNLQYYMELQQLRYEDCFEFDFKVDDQIDPEIILIPPMLVQPIVENAIEHGLSRMSNDGKISIEFKRDNKTLKVVIQDNGVGILLANQENKDNIESERESLSTQMIREQLSYFNAQLKGDFSIDFEHVHPDSERRGTRVVLRIPYIQQKASD